jgi:plasmid maintenance system antidote protein VapI
MPERLPITFHDLHSNLIHYLNQCVQRGELTERGIARRVGISQPHIHNVLKGKRLLSWESADTLLREFHIDLIVLANDGELAK